MYQAICNSHTHNIYIYTQCVSAYVYAYIYLFISCWIKQCDCKNTSKHTKHQPKWQMYSRPSGRQYNNDIAWLMSMGAFQRRTGASMSSALNAQHISASIAVSPPKKKQISRAWKKVNRLGQYHERWQTMTNADEEKSEHGNWKLPKQRSWSRKSFWSSSQAASTSSPAFHQSEWTALVRVYWNGSSKTNIRICSTALPPRASRNGRVFAIKYFIII